MQSHFRNPCLQNPDTAFLNHSIAIDTVYRVAPAVCFPRFELGKPLGDSQKMVVYLLQIHLSVRKSQSLSNAFSYLNSVLIDEKSLYIRRLPALL